MVWKETRQDKRQCLEIDNQTKRNPRHNRRTLQNVDQMLVGSENEGRHRTQEEKDGRVERSGGRGSGGGEGNTQRQMKGKGQVTC